MARFNYTFGWYSRPRLALLYRIAEHVEKTRVDKSAEAVCKYETPRAIFTLYELELKFYSFYVREYFFPT